MRIALVGATGLVGGVMLEVLKERNFPVTELIPVASERSVGKLIGFNGNKYAVVSMTTAIEMKPDIALFSAGGGTSKEWAPQFAKVGTTVIDNSSAWRSSKDHKLVVPEINGNELGPNDKIIANPNCSTIQMVLALAPLHRAFNIKRLIVSTYQSVTGTGVKAVEQMENERNDVKGNMVYPYPIDKNCLPHGGDFLENGYTSEEMKLVHETRKILSDNSINVSATVVRVPVVGGHSEAVNVEFSNPYKIQDVVKLLNDADGVTVQDDVKNNVYPMPRQSQHKDDVFVGRIRRDDSIANGLNLWIVADNLRKGAATNAVQIAEHLIKSGVIKQEEAMMA